MSGKGFSGAHAIAHGDVLAVLKELPDNEFDAALMDPPYGFSFMNKAWDYDVPSVDVWREALRVLKPGAPLIAFGGTRTFHRIAVGIEDAGFELRDCVYWMYGSHDLARETDPSSDAKPDAARSFFRRRFRDDWGPSGRLVGAARVRVESVGLSPDSPDGIIFVVRSVRGHLVGQRLEARRSTLFSVKDPKEHAAFGSEVRRLWAR